MPQKEVLLLLVLFLLLLGLSISGKLDVSSSDSQRYEPKPTPEPKPAFLPLDFPMLKKIMSATSEKSREIKMAPQSTLSFPPATGIETSESTEIPQESLNVLLDIPGSGTPFGGRISGTIDCDPLACGGANQLIIVGPPKGGIFAENYSTRVYEKYNISTGNWVLGKADGFDVCMEFVCSFDGCVCLPKGGAPAIEIIGTSD